MSIDNALPKAKQNEQNKQTTTRSPNKSAATYPATTKNALRSTGYTDLHNFQDLTVTKVTPARTTKH